MGKTGMGAGNEGPLWCLDQASREYIIVVSEKASSGLLQIKPFQNRHRKHVLSAKRKPGEKKNLSSYMQNNFKANFTPSCVTLSPFLITAEWIHIKIYVFKIITLAFETEGQVFC